MTLIARLKDYRQMRSTVEKIPIYCVFGDTVITSIAQSRPQTVHALLGVRGLTPEKCGQYGGDIIRLVQSSGPDPTPAPPVGDVVMRHMKNERAWEKTSRLGIPLLTSSESSASACGGGRRRGAKRKLLHHLVPRAPFVSVPALPPPASLVDTRGTGALQLPACPDDDIYVLELAHGRVYVGRSSDWRRRLTQHFSGRGSAFTQAYPPTGTLLPRLGCVSGSAEAAERDETLRYMFLRGINVVRGWKYTRVLMSEDDHKDAEENIRELFDLCRRCGCPGHFVTQCRATFDRMGRPCV